VIGFAGARVIEETIHEKLPEGFQRAEYLLHHGMIDQVVPRGELRATLGRILGLLRDRQPQAANVLPAEMPEDLSGTE
jgi:acetyl-CoA carboxylase carboxyl transferase subunit beta